MNEWQTVFEVLNERGIPLQVLIYPERYMDQFNVTRRRAAIKEMFKRGETIEALEAKTPFRKRYLREIVANGAEPNLPGFAEQNGDHQENSSDR